MTSPTPSDSGKYGRHLCAESRKATQMRLAERVLNEVCTGGQRQDSLAAQLADLERLANAIGCYDAADHIRRGMLS